MHTLSLTEAEDVLIVQRHGDPSWVEVRGSAGYATRHNPNDPLHAFLDMLDPATVSKLMSGDSVTLNPRNGRTRPSIQLCQNLMQSKGD